MYVVGFSQDGGTEHNVVRALRLQVVRPSHRGREPHRGRVHTETSRRAVVLVWPAAGGDCWLALAGADRVAAQGGHLSPHRRRIQPRQGKGVTYSLRLNLLTLKGVECTVICWVYCFDEILSYRFSALSVHWRCWLGGSKGIWPVKNLVAGCWHGYLSGARCRLAYRPADATATHCLLLQHWFYYLVPADPGSPGQRAVKQVCVCVCVCVSFSALYQSDKTAGSYYCAVVSFYFHTFSLSLSLLSFFPLFSLFLICFYFSFIRLFFSFFGHSPFLPFCLLPLSVYSVKEVGEVDVACCWLVKLEYFECWVLSSSEQWYFFTVVSCWLISAGDFSRTQWATSERQWLFGR